MSFKLYEVLKLRITRHSDYQHLGMIINSYEKNRKNIFNNTSKNVKV